MAAQNRIVLILLVAVLVAIAAVDLVFFPTEHLAILYVVPLAVATLRAPVWAVLLTAMAVFVLDFVAFYFDNAPLPVWFLTFVAIVVVCLFAFWHASSLDASE